MATDQDHILLGLAQKLMAAMGTVEMIEELDKTAMALSLPLGLTYVWDETHGELISLPKYRSVMDRIHDLVENLAGRRAQRTRNRLRLSAAGALAPLLAGQSIASHPGLALPQGEIRSAAEFVHGLIDSGLDLAGLPPDQFLAQLGVTAACLMPWGTQSLIGASFFFSIEANPAWKPGQKEVLLQMGRLLEPAVIGLKGLGSLHEMAEESQAWFAIAEILAHPRLSLDKRLQLCLETILKSLKASTGSIMLRQGRRLVVRAATTPKIVGLSQPLTANTIAARVARTGLTLNLDQAANGHLFERHAGEYSSYRVEQLLATPIWADRRVVGVLNITNRLGRTGFIRLEERRVSRFLERIGALIERAALTEKLKRERARLQTANLELKRLDKLQQDLTRMIVHDLKGPLAEISANLELLTDEPLGELGREALDAARLGTEDLARLIANLLDVARLEEGKLKPDLRPVEVDQVIEATLGRLKSLLALKGLQAVRAPEAQGGLVSADPNLIGRVLQNLLTNAVDFAPQESQLTITTLKQKGQMMVSLADHGPGVPAEHREVIFEKFKQLPSRHLPRISSGLGLAFCRLAVEAHGGKIWVQEGPGGGADFRFTLPLAEES